MIEVFTCIVVCGVIVGITVPRVTFSYVYMHACSQSREEFTFQDDILLFPEPTARSAVPGVSPGRGY